MPRKRRQQSSRSSGPVALRIIGGHHRGRKLKYSGDPGVRPMKDRVREALFNLLGPAIKDTYAIDLFGGTGALALEAISRGSVGAHIIEHHRPTANVIRENLETLGLEEETTLVTTSAFRWWASEPKLPTVRWSVFVSPPYRYFVQDRAAMLELVAGIIQRAPVGSLISVEATDEFDFSALPDAEAWDVRSYPPAVLGVYVCP